MKLSNVNIYAYKDQQFRKIKETKTKRYRVFLKPLFNVLFYLLRYKKAPIRPKGESS